MPSLTFLGAVEGVTGSMYLVQTRGSNILLDCGLFQGKREEERQNTQPFPFAAHEIDAVVLSHAHLDHSGRLPLLLKEGGTCPIFMTSPTLDLIEVLLKDAASLQQRDAEWENRRRLRAGKPQIDPLYVEQDVDQLLAHCQGCPYHVRINIADDVYVTFLDAGHILGSAIVVLSIVDADGEKQLVFSGDLGNSQAALLRDPDIIQQADVVLLESTYGDREHRSFSATLEEFESVIAAASQNGGNILIPSFAVGRTQEIIFRLGELYQQGKLSQQAIFLDSPMAIAVTEIYHRYQDVYNAEDKHSIRTAPVRAGRATQSLHSFLPILRYATSTQESMALNRIENGAIIIAGSGMCNGGRIRHHLKHNLWRNNAHVIFVGFQAQGTPGRALVEGAKTFKTAGETIIVRAAIHTMGGFSAHASQSQLLNWISHFKAARPRVFLVHGEQSAKSSLQSAITRQGLNAEMPVLHQVVQF